jgi:hypothetical protein
MLSVSLHTLTFNGRCSGNRPQPARQSSLFQGVDIAQAALAAGAWSRAKQRGGEAGRQKSWN